MACPSIAVNVVPVLERKVIIVNSSPDFRDKAIAQDESIRGQPIAWFAFSIEDAQVDPGNIENKPTKPKYGYHERKHGNDDIEAFAEGDHSNSRRLAVLAKLSNDDASGRMRLQIASILLAGTPDLRKSHIFMQVSVLSQFLIIKLNYRTGGFQNWFAQ